MARLPRGGEYALLFVAGLLLSGATMLQGIQPNDEGLMLQAAARISDGQVPYGDFWWFYPPGQPYLLGTLDALAGPLLLPWRIVRVLADATVALLAYALARREAPRALALAAWLVAILAMAYPSGPHPFPIALALGLGALLVHDERPALAGVLAGVCAAWRIEFAVVLAAGSVLTQLLRRDRPTRKIGVRPLSCAVRFVAAAAGTAALLYLPVVIAAGLGPSWDLLVDYPLTDFRDYQELPFPLDYEGPLNTSSIGGFLDDTAEPLLLFYLPLALLVGLAGSTLLLAPRRRPEHVAIGVFALGMVAYLLVRADLFHTAPLAVVGAVLAAWGLAEVRGRVAVAAAVLAGGGLVYAAVEGLDRRVLALTEDTVAFRDGVRADPRAAAELKPLVARIRQEVPPGEPIYVATRRADLVTAGHPLLYVLADRPNPTRYDIAAPGVVTTAPVQREIVADLERTRTRVVVRWTSPLTAAPEPNAAGRSSGVRLLDDYLAERYALAARFGSFLLLKRRA